jgi:hypothetical protein
MAHRIHRQERRLHSLLCLTDRAVGRWLLQVEYAAGVFTRQREKRGICELDLPVPP